jgi:hypothetical protein
MSKSLWTVPHLPSVMDSLWTDKTVWMDLTICPQSAHNCLGQALGLPTAAWITARKDAAVTHTDHSFYYDGLFKKVFQKKETDWTKKTPIKSALKITLD